MTLSPRHRSLISTWPADPVSPQPQGQLRETRKQAEGEGSFPLLFPLYSYRHHCGKASSPSSHWFQEQLVRFQGSPLPEPASQRPAGVPAPGCQCAQSASSGLLAYQHSREARPLGICGAVSSCPGAGAASESSCSCSPRASSAPCNSCTVPHCPPFALAVSNPRNQFPTLHSFC